MKPILHIINNPDDTQAIDIIKTQGRDNAYGVAAVFIGEAPPQIPSAPDVRLCILREDAAAPSPIPLPSGERVRVRGNGGFEVIGYDYLLNLIFSVESISVW
ncbi:MAG: hypothetical protein PH343_06685 [Nitrospira sp.]|nr:hypothetical protein [Nitrospira sp.]